MLLYKLYRPFNPKVLKKNDKKEEFFTCREDAYPGFWTSIEREPHTDDAPPA